MYDHRWNNLINRIIEEAKYRNGTNYNAVVKVNISVIVQKKTPIMWEVVNASKIEPATDVIKNLAGFTETLKQLSDKCEDPAKLNQVLQEAIDKL